MYNVINNINYLSGKNSGNLGFRSVCIMVVILALSFSAISAQPWPTTGWEVAASPEAAGMKPDILADFNTWFTQTKNAQASAWGYIIIRNGKIVTENYGNGGARDIKWDIGSIRKPVSSALLGMAIKEGKIKVSNLV
jgi:CubicO group peptidase (beta-lactamase class C family)